MGFGVVGLARSLDRDEQLQMIDLNVRALTELSLAFVDSLARHRGGLLNVGSMAGFLPGPGMAIYYATKAYVLSFTEALHSELKPLGIRVAVLCPGPVLTEFAERAGLRSGDAEYLDPVGGLCGGGGLSRTGWRDTERWCPAHQQTGHHLDPHGSAQARPENRGFPAKCRRSARKYSRIPAAIVQTPAKRLVSQPRDNAPYRPC
jgi:hypothetical protein